MPTTAVRILTVGDLARYIDSVLARLLSRGHGSHRAASVTEARETLATFHYDVVLAREQLPDGRGYELADIVARSSATLIIAISLSETCLWLPAVDRGLKVLGERAVNMTSLEWDIEEHLAAGAKRNAKAVRQAAAERAASARAAVQIVPGARRALEKAAADRAIQSVPDAAAGKASQAVVTKVPAKIPR